MTKEIKDNEALASKRRQVIQSLPGRLRVFNDYSLEFKPQATGEPAQLDVKKIGKSKRYVTNGKSPLACLELKVPADVPDRAAAFFAELDKLTKDIQLSIPELPKGKFLMDEENLKIHRSNEDGEITVWFTLRAKSLFDLRRDLYNLTSIIDKCFVINQA